MFCFWPVDKAKDTRQIGLCYPTLAKYQMRDLVSYHLYNTAKNINLVEFDPLD